MFLLQIAKRYDILLIQEIRDSSETTDDKFLAAINEDIGFVSSIDVKNVFYVFFYFGHVFTLLTFFIFHRFLFKKNVGKVFHSCKQINKKHFRNNSNEIDLWFFCCMSNDLKCLPINFYILTMFDACLNGIFRVA